MKIVFGVISWFPDKEPDRSLRIERINRMFKQIQDAFGEVEWIVIAQNWKGYNIPEFVKAKIFKYPALGILGARKELRRKFLELGYDYLIMCDDDIIIQYEDGAPKRYLEEIKKHPNGFCVIRYDFAQLNLLAISKYIYEKEPMVNIDPQKDEGFEDCIFSELLHYKYPLNEFKVEGITHIQFNKSDEEAPSTWAYVVKRDWSMLCRKTSIYIEEFKKGNFDVDAIKNTADAKARHEEWLETARMNGWIN